MKHGLPLLALTALLLFVGPNIATANSSHSVKSILTNYYELLHFADQDVASVNRYRTKRIRGGVSRSVSDDSFAKHQLNIARLLERQGALQKVAEFVRSDEPGKRQPLYLIVDEAEQIRGIAVDPFAGRGSNKQKRTIFFLKELIEDNGANLVIRSFLNVEVLRLRAGKPDYKNGRANVYVNFYSGGTETHNGEIGRTECSCKIVRGSNGKWQTRNYKNEVVKTMYITAGNFGVEMISGICNPKHFDRAVVRRNEAFQLKPMQ